ncbi:MAG: PIG-L deacetylase family protein [Anaerolineales bacterium]
MNFYGRRVLFIGAHPDDIELGSGAMLAAIAGATDVHCLTLSDNQQNPELADLVQEHLRSMAILGIDEHQIRIEQFETRNFSRDRQQILEHLYAVNQDYRPDMVFTHSPADIHQDHAITTQEALRAFRGKTVLGFDVLRSSYGFFPNFIVEVQEEHVELKIKALGEYRTYKDRYYFDPEVIRSTLVRHGAIAEHPYAEGFDILRVVGSFKG